MGNSNLNYEVLFKMRELQIEGEPDVVVEVVSAFLELVPERLAAIQRHFHDQNWALLGKEFHSLKSSCRVLGAEQLGQLCENMEKFGENQEKENILSNYAEFKNLFSHVREELSQFCAEAKKSAA